MVRVILKRIGLAFLTLFGVTVIVFALLQMMPGEPIDSIVPLDASEELRQVIIDQYGFGPATLYAVFHVAGQRGARQIFRETLSATTGSCSAWSARPSTIP